MKTGDSNNPWLESLMTCTVGGDDVEVCVRIVDIGRAEKGTPDIDGVFRRGNYGMKLSIVDCVERLDGTWEVISKSIVDSKVISVSCFGLDAENFYWYVIDQNVAFDRGGSDVTLVQSFDDGSYGELARELVMTYVGSSDCYRGALLVIFGRFPSGGMQGKQALSEISQNIRNV